MPKSVQQLLTRDYTYDLPDHRIARYPLENRDDARLLIFQHGEIQESHYRALHTCLPTGSLLVFNDTKVIPARLQFQKETGGLVEVFCLEPLHEQTTALGQTGSAGWKCLVGGAKKWKQESLHCQHPEIHLTATWIDRKEQLIQFNWEPHSWSFAEVLDKLGAVPLPPYLARPAETSDKARYQTIFARYEGSVAAPTAGLHFTDSVFKKFRETGIHTTFVTLHVGAGTFKPVQSDRLGAHEMHAEYFEVSLSLIEQLAQNQNPVVAVGTTSLRTLETLYQMGRKLNHFPGHSPESLWIRQWDAYENIPDCTPQAALSALSRWMNHHHMDRLVSRTQLLIAPGYPLKMIEALITNFHQPNSTLLLLVAACVGTAWRNVYQYALDNDFRFLSFGDGCLLYKS
jgi:S-adenosylmethionine:tRNA ribosyltransferase-isomerase